MTGLIRGNDVLFLVDKGNGYVPFVCAKDLSIQITSGLVPVATVNDGEWEKYKYSTLGYTISLSGVVRFSDADLTSFDIMEYQRNFLPLLAKLIFVDQENNNQRTFKGQLLVESSSLSGNAGAFSLSDFSLRGSGKPVFVSCDATIGIVAIQITGLSSISVSLSNIEGFPDHYLYQLDSGFEIETTQTSFNILNIPGGYHTLTVTPVFASGNRGDAIVQDFNTDNTVNNPTCGVPNSVSISDQTKTSFRVNWAPGASNTGTNIQVKNINTGATQYFNDRPSTSFIVTDLLPGGNYQVFVIGDCGGFNFSAPFVINASTLSDSSLPILTVNNFSDTVTVTKITINGVVVANFSISPHTNYSFDVAPGLGPILIEYTHSNSDESSISVATQNQMACQAAAFNGAYTNTYSEISIASTGISININPNACTG